MERFQGRAGPSYVKSTLRQVELYLTSLKDGQPVNIEVKQIRPNKTNQQVRTVMGYMMTEAITQANDLGIDSSTILAFLLDGSIPKGSPITKDLLHEVMYLVCPTTDEDGRRTTLSKMDTQQAAKLFETFRAVLAPLGIVIADPDPDWKGK